MNARSTLAIPILLGSIVLRLAPTVFAGHDPGGNAQVDSGALANLHVADPLLVTNPVSQLAHRGQTVVFAVSVSGTEPLHYQWRKDGVDLQGGTSAQLVLTNVQATDAGGYDVVATNTSGSVTSAVATLGVNLTLADSAAPVFNASIWTFAVQNDGKILAGGAFTTIGGQSCPRLGRLNADGSFDASFNPGANDLVSALAVQPNGAIIVGGFFTSLGGQARRHLARVNRDGSVDMSFNPGTDNVVPNSVHALAVQPDGRILVGGSFVTMAGQTRLCIGRLNPDGSLDTNFLASADSTVFAIGLQADGRIVMGGHFTTVNGQPHPGLARLESDGTLDATFNASASDSVLALAVQADGRIVVGGIFSTLNGEPRGCLGRLNPDGTLDRGFDPPITYALGPNVRSLVVDTDGRIVVSGGFTAIAGEARNFVARLAPDGSVDEWFNPGSGPTPSGYNAIMAVAIQPDGAILAGGGISSLGGQARASFARLVDTAAPPLVNDIPFNTAPVSWLRSGPGPEVWRAHFAHSTNGVDWTDLGDGVRIAGGWRLPSGTSFDRGVMHARGFVVSGNWHFDTFGGPPLWVVSPVSQTNGPATTATFSASALGAAPLAYQWLKDGTRLDDGGNISGATTATLTVTNVFGADAGGYAVVLSNACGVVTSAVATLTVLDPWLTSQPSDQLAQAGQSATFSVAALGTPPLAYRWRHDGVEVADATSATLTLTNLQPATAGTYDVIVSNAFGSVTSAVAVLTLNLAVPDSFNPGADGPVATLAIQPDGRILVGGSFTHLAGQMRRRLGRLNPDGTLDAAFNPGGNPGDSNAYSGVSALLVQPDGGMLVAGSRGGRQSEFRASVWRLDNDGNEATNFVATFTGSVNALAQQVDETIWAGGAFTVAGPAATTNLARFLDNGSLDSNFVAVADGAVITLALQTDGKLLVGGAFTMLNGANRSRLARFHADGTLDSGFNPGANDMVRAIVVQPEGTILVGGAFTALAKTDCNRIGRLNPDGTVDPNFNPNANGTVHTLALQTDGRILLGGSFTTVSGLGRLRLARVHADGRLDAFFNPAANSIIGAIAIQADGALMVGGGFTVLAGQARTNLGRLVNTEPARESLHFDGSTVTWRREGTGPECWRTTFDGSTNGADWIALGAGVRSAHGWELVTAFPVRSMIRARGFTTGGLNNGSGWFAESIHPTAVPPRILSDDAGFGFQQNRFGFALGALEGQRVVVEISTDLLLWTPLATIRMETAVTNFTDFRATNAPWQFYRLKLE